MDELLDYFSKITPGDFFTALIGTLVAWLIYRATINHGRREKREAAKEAARRAREQAEAAERKAAADKLAREKEVEAERIRVAEEQRRSAETAAAEVLANGKRQLLESTNTILRRIESGRENPYSVCASRALNLKGAVQELLPSLPEDRRSALLCAWNDYQNAQQNYPPLQQARIAPSNNMMPIYNNRVDHIRPRLLALRSFAE